MSESCLLCWAGLAFICLASPETLAARRAGCQASCTAPPEDLNPPVSGQDLSPLALCDPTALPIAGATPTAPCPAAGCGLKAAAPLQKGSRGTHAVPRAVLHGRCRCQVAELGVWPLCRAGNRPRCWAGGGGSSPCPPPVWVSGGSSCLGSVLRKFRARGAPVAASRCPGTGWGCCHQGKAPAAECQPCPAPSASLLQIQSSITKFSACFPLGNPAEPPGAGILGSWGCREGQFPAGSIALG